MIGWWKAASLGTKIQLLIQAVLLLVLLGAQAWLMDRFRGHALQAAEDRAMVSADGVINGMNMLMVTGMISIPENRRLYIKKMGASEDVKELRIVRAQQVSDQFGPGLPEEQIKDELDQRAIETKLPQFQLDADATTPTLRAVVPFIVSTNFRGTNCLQCHLVEVGSVNGAASIVLDLSDDYAQIRRINATLWVGQGLLQALLFFLIGWFVRTLIQPLKKLRATITRIRTAGDLSLVAPEELHVAPASGDEIGELTESFNHMARTLRQQMVSLHQAEDMRLRADAELRERETLFRTIFNRAGDAIELIDTENLHVIEINEAACRLMGYEREEYLRLTVQDLEANFSPADLQANLQLLRQRQNMSFASKHRRKDGRIIDIDLNVSLIHLQSREYIVAVWSDVTDRRRADEEMRIAATVFESQEAMLVTTPAAEIIRVNEAFSRITGYSAEEVVGRNPRILQSGRHDKKFYQEMWDTILSQGSWQGEVWDKRKNGQIYPKWLTISCVRAGGGRISHFVGSFTDISERKEAEHAVSRLAYYDPLTGLPNRRLLVERLQRALAVSTRHQRYGALLFLDLDDFKTINDTLGHDAGDLLLQEVAARLQSTLRESDSIARIGGDEFVVLLEELDDRIGGAATYAKEVADKLLAAVSRPYQLRGSEYGSSVSIGVTIWGNESKESVLELLRRSDLAMYEAKKGGRNTVRFFDPQMQQQLEQRTRLEGDLRLALAEGQFQLFYQKRVGADGIAKGAEALLRWNHPRRGLLAPNEFIPLAEDTGLIIPLGAFALNTACRQLKDWEDAERTRDLIISVNISAREFMDTGFVQRVGSILSATLANPRLLELEITESMLLADIESLIEKMNKLREIGVSIALDDFGTGYSSLSYLKTLPINLLKIDRSFVKDLGSNESDSIIVQTIIRMGQTLGMEVIAEGVETVQQKTILAQHGCTNYQGYLFGKPVPIEVFEREL